MSTAPTPSVVRMVLERDQWCCVMCGRPLTGTRGFHWSIHHRQARGMGGSKAAHINQPSNLVSVCGHGTFACHGEIERLRYVSEAMGLIVRRPALPAHQPVHITGPRFPIGATVYLSDDGRYLHEIDEAAVTDVELYFGHTGPRGVDQH